MRKCIYNIYDYADGAVRTLQRDEVNDVFRFICDGVFNYSSSVLRTTWVGCFKIHTNTFIHGKRKRIKIGDGKHFSVYYGHAKLLKTSCNPCQSLRIH